MALIPNNVRQLSTLPTPHLMHKVVSQHRRCLQSIGSTGISSGISNLDHVEVSLQPNDVFQEHLELRCLGWLSLERGTLRKIGGNLGRRGPSLLSVSSSSSSTKILTNLTPKYGRISGFLTTGKRTRFFCFFTIFFSLAVSVIRILSCLVTDSNLKRV